MLVVARPPRYAIASRWALRAFSARIRQALCEPARILAFDPWQMALRSLCSARSSAARAAACSICTRNASGMVSLIITGTLFDAQCAFSFLRRLFWKLQQLSFLIVVPMCPRRCLLSFLIVVPMCPRRCLLPVSLPNVYC